METYKKISGDVIRKTVTEEIDLAPLKKELEEIEERIKDLEKQPDEIMMPNINKLSGIESLKNRKEEISNLLMIK